MLSELRFEQRGAADQSDQKPTASLAVRIFRLEGGRLRIHSAIGDVVHVLEKWIAVGAGKWRISAASDNSHEVWVVLEFPSKERESATYQMQQLCDEYGLHAVRSS